MANTGEDLTAAPQTDKLPVDRKKRLDELLAALAARWKLTPADALAPVAFQGLPELKFPQGAKPGQPGELVRGIMPLSLDGDMLVLPDLHAPRRIQRDRFQDGLGGYEYKEILPEPEPVSLDRLLSDRFPEIREALAALNPEPDDSGDTK